MEWLERDHVREYWDNSREHKDDIRIFAEGRKEVSHYYDGMFDYWVGSEDAEPFCLLMTSIVQPEEELAEIWRAHLSKTGRSVSIDFFIGEEAFLGHGLATDTLKAFVAFFRAVVDPEADTFFIDPDLDNLKALHVYAKAGFVAVGTYVVQLGFFKGRENQLMVLRAA
jgi:RimJ/RimL family protein N-acetyltransferase